LNSLESLHKIVLIIEYDGTRYLGSQYQPGGPTIQNELEEAFYKLTGERLRANFASRTDSGVSALGQVASLLSQTALDNRRIVGGLNYYLPGDMAVQAAYRVRADLDVRHEAVSRSYRYSVLNRDIPSPVRERFLYRIGGTLDGSLMTTAAKRLIGEHDFASFASQLGNAWRNTVRRMLDCHVNKCGGIVEFFFTANSFLPHQIRNTVGVLLRVGQGKMNMEDFEQLIAQKKPGAARPAAPAKGLCLVKINYPFNLEESEK